MSEYDSVDTLHYADPPYVHETRREVNGRVREGYRHEMTEEDHLALMVHLNTLLGAIVLSGYDSDLYRDRFTGWDRIENDGAYTLHAKPRTEVLWLKNVHRDLFR